MCVILVAQCQEERYSWQYFTTLNIISYAARGLDGTEGECPRLKKINRELLG